MPKLTPDQMAIQQNPHTKQEKTWLQRAKSKPKEPGLAVQAGSDFPDLLSRSIFPHFQLVETFELVPLPSCFIDDTSKGICIIFGYRVQQNHCSGM